MVPSGILLPGDEPLTLKKVVEGLYLIQNAYVRDYGFFSRLPFYGKRPLVPEAETGGEVESERTFTSATRGE